MTVSTPAPVHVLTAPGWDPGQGRRTLDVVEGMTIKEIVALALPGGSSDDLSRVRVALVNRSGSMIIEQRHWHCIRPRNGAQVVIRIVPGEDALRSILTIVVSVAAMAFGGPLASFLFNTTSKLAVSLVTAGLTIVGHLAVNALIPPPKPEDRKRENRYAIGGWRNTLDPDGAIPVVAGEIRYAPPFAALSYTEIVGNWQYIRSLFVFGYGELDLTDFRIGETSIAEFDEVEIEVRRGVEGEDPVSIYPRQVAEEAIGVELTRPLPRDDTGEIEQIEEEYTVFFGGRPIVQTRLVNAPAIETPVVRTTGADASAASVILAFPAGLVRFDDKGRKKGHSVSVRIEQRRIDADEWQHVNTLSISADALEGFYRQFTWVFPERGRWQVRVTMMTDETESTSIQQRCQWAALQTIRPEYPIAFSRPLALVAVRVKATHQLSGTLDNFSALAVRVCLDWDKATRRWMKRATSNPASLYRYALQSPANPKPVADTDIDLDLLADWHEFCTAKELSYKRVLDSTDTTLREVLVEICGAGRASPRFDGMLWGVTIDRPGEFLVDEISPRNSRGLSVSRAYIDPPHAFRVKFLDEDNDFKPAERLVRWPGYEGEIDLTEALELPGTTNASAVFREARRRQLEAIHRPDSYQVTQDGPIRVATRGDTVTLTSDVLDSVQSAARVKRVFGQMIEIDDPVAMDAGSLTYAIRFRAFGQDDTVGTSIVRTVRMISADGKLLTLEGEGETPAVGSVILVGALGRETAQVVVRGVEAAEDFASILHLVDAAPQIDEILDATEIPAWSSRVGAEIDLSLLEPPAPVWRSIASGIDGADAANEIRFILTTGSGAVATAQYHVEHRPSGGAQWAVMTVSAAASGGSIFAYAAGAAVELRACAISDAGIAGPFTPAVALIIGAGDLALPDQIDPAAISVTELLGGALLLIATGADDALAKIQVYRSQSSVLDRETDAVGEPMAAGAQQTYSIALGDTTRSDLCVGGSMIDAGAWTAGTGWSISGGAATHAAGSASSLAQAFAPVAGKWYRIAYTVLGHTAGSVTPQLTGGSVRAGTAVSGNGDMLDRIQAVTGNVSFEFTASADFDGSIDAVNIYQETTACLEQGDHFVWVEPQNDDSVAGPVSGPIQIHVR